jgi:hypothetical protein
MGKIINLTHSSKSNRLLHLLNQHSKDPSDAHYEQLITEILHGDSCFLLPAGDHEVEDRWREPGTEYDLEIRTVYHEGPLKVLLVFSDEEALEHWAQRPINHHLFRTQDAIKFCQQNGIARIIINVDQENMFVLQQRLPETKAVAEEHEELRLLPLQDTLGTEVIDLLKASFAETTVIDAGYQFAKVNNANEPEAVIGIRLSEITDDTIKAMQLAVAQALYGKDLKRVLHIMLLESDTFVAAAESLKGKFYQRLKVAQHN